MPLDALPVELRLHIYQYLPELRPGRHETVAPHIPLTPGICRASKWLRRETLPLYAGNAHFSLQTDEDAYPKGNRVSIWLDALGSDKASKHVRSFQLSRHWSIKEPTRWQGHVGFYFRLERVVDRWQTSAGTYPIANDTRGLRAESVRLLLRVVRETVISDVEARERRRLRRSDVECIAAAMDVVASRPFSPYDTEQSEEGRRRRRKAMADLEGALCTAMPKSGSQAGAPPSFTST
ncbi:hypothetical protein B0A55_12474 [Friedmanniomyces simplex]|uniref:F-box domain-containing protein n=1 Tax=Friedmanniomyces simplex TaxID=329884 RepID=A0A4U0VPM3_9PEZI|nr:hypothetical protein B0A55_12474 [Friedmanniomyces simplex]